MIDLLDLGYCDCNCFCSMYLFMWLFDIWPYLLSSILWYFPTWQHILIIFSYLTAYCDRPCLRWQRGGGAPEDYKNMNFPGFNLFWFWSFIFVWETRCFRRTSFLSRIQSVRPPTYSFWVRCRGIFHFRTAFCLRFCISLPSHNKMYIHMFL